LIKRLHIRDFAVIDELELDLDAGLTVLTGETGAGKSILVDAVGLLLGDRADAGVIRDGKDRAEIAAVFDVAADPGLRGLLDDQAIEYPDDELMLRRVISRDGRSGGYVNGSPATAQLLRNLGECLVDIYGQHSHLSLIKPDNQRRLLDDYGDYPADLQAVRRACERWRELTGKLQALLGHETDQTASLALLRYQIEELQALHPEPGEYELLDEEHRRLANGQRLLETAGMALRALEDDDHSLRTRIGAIATDLKALRQYDPALANLVRILEEATLQINEAGAELRRYLDTLQLDPERLQAVENRLALLHGMARKHKMQPRELPAHLATLEQQLAQLEHNRRSIDELRQAQYEAMTSYQSAAAALHQRRQQAARRMSAAIAGKLGELGMTHGKFAIEVSALADRTPQPHGNDQVEFLVSTNPGLALQPLRKIASGGELSRISLAIQVIGGQDKGTPTLIFDEVDAGIGGAVAEIVGRLLRGLARQRQVFCVTHLPQVAAQGNHHLLVDKTSTRNSTRTGVQSLSAESRVEEIARMLGGVKITEQSRRHAAEMLQGKTKSKNRA
jgi:DNA repair protein RecN (Recombination protein N)